MNDISLHHVSLLVDDTERALAFWRDLLGLAVDPARPDLGYPGAWLRAGPGLQIHLLELPDPCAGRERPEHGGRDAHVALRVGDFDGLRRRLEAAGFRPSLSRSGRRAMFVRDADGNAVELIAAD